MNTDQLQQKIDDIIRLLQVSLNEAKDIEAKRVALENTSYVTSDREKKLYVREVEFKKKVTDLEAQAKVIEEQNHNTQIILNKIILEKEGLKELVNQKRTIEQERLQLEADKKGFKIMKAEKDKYLQERAEFEKERQLFSKEKLALHEAQQLMAKREENLKKIEEKYDKIEQLTSI